MILNRYYIIIDDVRMNVAMETYSNQIIFRASDIWHIIEKDFLRLQLIRIGLTYKYLYSPFRWPNDIEATLKPPSKVICASAIIIIIILISYIWLVR